MGTVQSKFSKFRRKFRRPAVAGPTATGPAPTSTAPTPAPAPVVLIAASTAVPIPGHIPAPTPVPSITVSNLPPQHGTPATTPPSNVPMTTTTKNPTPAAIPSSSGSLTQTPATSVAPSTKGSSDLWQKAVEKLRSEGRGDLDCGKKYDFQLVHELIKELKQKKEECDEGRWFYINKNGEKEFFVENLLGQLNKYARVVDIAIQHHPDIVALVWSGFRMLLQVGTAYTENMKAVCESLGYLVRILCCCDIYEKLYCGRSFESIPLLRNLLVDLYASILEYLCYARGYLQQNTGARVLESFFSDLGQLLDKVQNLEKDMEAKACLAEKEAAEAGRCAQEEGTKELKGLLTEIQSEVKTIFTHVERQRRLEVLGWLSNVMFHDHHSYASRRRHNDTGHWLLGNKKYLDWKLSKSSSIIWLRGDAGSGKTTLASKIIDEFQQQTGSHALAYFYCYYKDGDRDDPVKILRAIVKQICLASPGGCLPAPLLSIYEKREKDGHSSGPLNLDESQELIKKLSEGFQQTTIVIDALDECNPRTRRGLFSAFNNIVTGTKHIKIFVTGRNDGDIHEMLVEFPSHYIDATDNTADINIYIDSEIERRCHPKQLKNGEKPLLKGEAKQELKEEIISTLKSKANGMFMWVHFQIIAICEEYTTGAVEKALENLPKDLDTTYKQVFERIDSQTEATRKTARKILGWILHARGLSSWDIIQALGVESVEADMDIRLEWSVSSILDICQNFLVHDAKLERFRFAHLSVQEFLQRQPEFSQYETTHTSIAKICLTVLTHHYSARRADLVPELLHYSTLHWGDHMRLSGAGSSELRNLCIEFLRPSPPYEAWSLRVIKEVNYLRGDKSQAIPPLWTACYYQLKSMVGMLLEQNKVDVNCVNKYGLTPLLLTMERGYKDIVGMLLEKDGVNVNCVNKYGSAPLLLAIENGYKDIVGMLLEKDGVNVNCVNKYGSAPLLLAIKNGYKDIVGMLLEKDRVDVNCVGKLGGTPILLAIENGYKDIVGMLLENDRVDVNCVNNYGSTPLLLAIDNGYQGIIRMLLEKDGVDMNCAGKRGLTPLIWASVKGDKDIVGMLLEKNEVDVNCAQGDWTPLLWAIWKGNKNIVGMLLEKDGVDVNFTSKEGDTALSLAKKTNDTEILQILLQNGASR